MTNRDKLKEYEGALLRGLAWILSHRNPDGSFGDTHERKTIPFKVPMALFDNGYRAEAWAYMRWLQENTFTAEGDFEDPRPGYHAAHWPYRNLWFIRAAHFLELYEISHPAMDYVRRFRNPMLLGFLGFMVANLLLVTMPAGNYLLLLISVLIEAVSLTIFGPLMDALTIISIDNAERARINSILAMVVIWGAVQMSNLENYRLAVSAAILATLSCISPWFLLGVPFGIWALVVLCDEGVKDAFWS